MVRPIILGIIGEKSSGKSAVFQYLRRKRGVYSARTSDVLFDILVRLSLDPTDRRNESKLGEGLRKTFGPDILPRAVMADPRAQRSRVIAVEGFRRLAELAPLQRSKNFHLLYITAPAVLRWQRAKSRTINKRHDDRVSFTEFQKSEQTVITEREIPKMGKLADVRIENIGTKTELFRKIDAALRRFGVEKKYIV